MCSTFSLCDVEWKLCAHTTSDVQTSKLAQCDTILACCWYQWCEYCRFVIFQLFFLKYMQSSKSNIDITGFELRCVLVSLFWLSSGNCAHTLQATYKHQNLHNVILYYNIQTIKYHNNAELIFLQHMFFCCFQHQKRTIMKYLCKLKN